MKKQFKTLNLSKEFMEHFNGLMLGDGSLSNKRKSKYSASIIVKSKNLDYINWLAEIFTKEEIEFKTLSATKGNFAGSKDAYQIETKFYVNFSELEDIWYQYDRNGSRRKTIPNDLELKPNTVLQWYLGDGYVTNLRDIPQRIMFCTDRYNEFETEKLLNLLSKNYDVQVNMADRNRLRIPKKDMVKFLEQIPMSPTESFKYKWKPLFVI